MKSKFTLLFLAFLAFGANAQTQNFYDFSWPSLAGDTIPMSRYTGKKVMVVNVASYCTYTPEFAPLSQLDSIYSARYNFAILGFPCNDYGGQRGSDSVVLSTCGHYNVHFQIMSTVHIRTSPITPLYQWLESAALNGVASNNVTWNFNKFLIDRQGNWVKWYDSPVSPVDSAITNWIIADSASASGINSPVESHDMFQLVSGNPANEAIMLYANSDFAQKLDVNLYSMDGSLIGNIYTGDLNGSRNFAYSLSNVPSGIYLIKASGQTIDRTIKCVVQH